MSNLYNIHTIYKAKIHVHVILPHRVYEISWHIFKVDLTVNL
jgi:hypothetical protein